MEEGTAKRPLEQIILTTLGAGSLQEVNDAIKNDKWPFAVTPPELYKRLAEEMGRPASADDIAELLTGGKSAEEVRSDIEQKKWPFMISADDMRNSLAADRNNPVSE